MKKIIDKKKYNKIPLTMLMCSVIGLNGCANFKEVTPVDKEIGGLYINVIPESETSKEIDYYTFDELKDIYACLVYSTSKSGVCYDVEFMKRVENNVYTAYYEAKSGDLVSLTLNELNDGDVDEYKYYLNNQVIELGSAYEELFRDDLSDSVLVGIDYDNETITSKSYTYLELGYIHRNADNVKEKVSEIGEEKGLSR